jgi:hypothetical protein
MTVSHAGGCVDGSGARVPGHPTAAKKLGNGGIEYTLAATAAHPGDGQSGLVSGTRQKAVA